MTFKRLLMPMLVLGIMFIMGNAAFAQVTCSISSVGVAVGPCACPARSDGQCVKLRPYRADCRGSERYSGFTVRHSTRNSRRRQSARHLSERRPGR
jgi:hypothetical protein